MLSNTSATVHTDGNVLGLRTWPGRPACWRCIFQAGNHLRDDEFVHTGWFVELEGQAGAADGGAECLQITSAVSEEELALGGHVLLEDVANLALDILELLLTACRKKLLTILFHY